MDTGPLAPVTLHPVGVVRGGRSRPDDDGWDAETCTIELDPSRFGPDSLAGLDGFAQRGRVRPNRLGVTVCRLLAVDGQGVRVRGLDAIDGTPVLDLKPYLVGFGPRGEVVEPSWATEIMADYW